MLDSGVDDNNFGDEAWPSSAACAFAQVAKKPESGMSRFIVPYSDVGAADSLPGGVKGETVRGTMDAPLPADYTPPYQYGL